MTDLGLLLSPGPSAALRRELGADDLDRLARAPRGSLQAKPQLVKKIRHTHHNLARLLASGLKHEEISRITGYSPAYISSLQTDPAFANLVGYYNTLISEDFKEVQISLHERLTASSMLAAEELQERLSESPEEFSVSELNEVLKTTADRTGFGPQTKNTNVNVNVDLAGRLEAARRRAFGQLPALSAQSGQEETKAPIQPLLAAPSGDEVILDLEPAEGVRGPSKSGDEPRAPETDSLNESRGPKICPDQLK